MSLPIVLGYIYGFIQLAITEMSLLFTAFSKGIQIGNCLLGFMMMSWIVPMTSAGISWCIFPKQEPKHLLIGLTGVSVCFTVSSFAILIWKTFMWTSVILTVVAFCTLPFFLKTYVTNGKTYFIKDLTGVKVNWLRIACGYFATLPIFLYFLMQHAPGYPVYGFILHFGVFYFLIEASLVHKATIFREYEENNTGHYRPKVLVRIVKVKEEEKNTAIYNFFEFLRMLT